MLYTLLITFNVLLYVKDFIYLLFERWEGKEKEERNINVYERNTDQLPRTCPQLGTGPQPRHVTCLGTEPVTFRSVGWQSIH